MLVGWRVDWSSPGVLYSDSLIPQPFGDTLARVQLWDADNENVWGQYMWDPPLEDFLERHNDTVFVYTHDFTECDRDAGLMWWSADGVAVQKVMRFRNVHKPLPSAQDTAAGISRDIPVMVTEEPAEGDSAGLDAEIPDTLIVQLENFRQMWAEALIPAFKQIAESLQSMDKAMKDARQTARQQSAPWVYNPATQKRPRHHR